MIFEPAARNGAGHAQKPALTGRPPRTGRCLVPARYGDHMATQMAVRTPDAALAALDDAIRAGRFENRAAAVREGPDRLLREEHERAIAASYRRAYMEHPEEEWIGEVGLALAAQRLEDLDGRTP